MVLIWYITRMSTNIPVVTGDNRWVDENVDRTLTRKVAPQPFVLYPARNRQSGNGNDDLPAIPKRTNATGTSKRVTAARLFNVGHCRQAIALAVAEFATIPISNSQRVGDSINPGK